MGKKNCFPGGPRALGALAQKKGRPKVRAWLNFRDLRAFLLRFGPAVPGPGSQVRLDSSKGVRTFEPWAGRREGVGPSRGMWLWQGESSGIYRGGLGGGGLWVQGGATGQPFPQVRMGPSGGPRFSGRQRGGGAGLGRGTWASNHYRGREVRKISHAGGKKTKPGPGRIQAVWASVSAKGSVTGTNPPYPIGLWGGERGLLFTDFSGGGKLFLIWGGGPPRLPVYSGWGVGRGGGPSRLAYTSRSQRRQGKPLSENFQPAMGVRGTPIQG